MKKCIDCRHYVGREHFIECSHPKNLRANVYGDKIPHWLTCQTLRTKAFWPFRKVFHLCGGDWYEPLFKMSKKYAIAEGFENE